MRVVRQLLTESLIIPLFGGALGLGMAFSRVRELIALLPSALPRAHDLHVSGPVLVFISVLTGILFGMAPGMHASRTDPKH